MKEYILKKILIVLLIICICSISYALIIPKNENPYRNNLDEEIINNYINECEVDENGFLPKDIKVDDIVHFGNYCGEPIEWIVMDKNEVAVLLLTRYIIETVPYNKTLNPTNWETCSLRKWLNETFYNSTFTDSEKTFILPVRNLNQGNHIYNIKPIEDTLDNVFLFSIAEAKRYFGIGDAMKCLGTNHALEEGLWISKVGPSKGYSVWWLRNPGRSVSYAALVHAGGTIGYIGDGVSTLGNGVRPCIWVSLR